jgi:hypothetical protein
MSLNRPSAGGLDLAVERLRRGIVELDRIGLGAADRHDAAFELEDALVLLRPADGQLRHGSEHFRGVGREGEGGM